MHLGFGGKKMKLAFMLVQAIPRKKKFHFSAFKSFQALDSPLNGFLALLMDTFTKIDWIMSEDKW